MLQVPGESQYDLNFRLLGFHVRIAWGFWVICAVLGYGWTQGMGYIAQLEGMASPGMAILLLIFATAVFFSILIHELGHTIAFQYYGIGSRIVLYHFGGLAVPDSFGAWNGARQRRIGPQEQIVISAAGPALQLLLGLMCWTLGTFAGVRVEMTGDLNNLLGLSLPMGEYPSNVVLYAALDAFVWISVVWAILNLAPILPLDGGQIMRSILLINNVRQPDHTAHLVSVVAGVGLGIASFRFGLPGGMFFLIFAIINWQQMQGGYGRF